MIWIKKMRTWMLIALGLIILSLPVIAHGEDTFAQAEELIKQKIPCEDLGEEQLEIVGDYYMEQMHPGEAHEIMDERMGGEGSESLRQVHITMARSFYCGEHQYMSGDMMNRMMGRGGMMNMMNYGSGYGMMGTGGWLWMGFFWLIWIALAAFVFGIIFWFTYRLIIKEKRKK